ncbi:enoyl-CoA hydratase-related protein [Rhodococcus sp. CSLK01-03]|uniref:Enoyl-CoA hydratase-related protein n=1 Tax=Rhodococcus indonesiensis TaxID=3055869 RepID=A0ABT7RQU2_9NOCA|nr:enoyl-CoA hydratase-related protein [Rhodococcus indonesiensis]MDM7489341.1 enoyl-CoA hydratase-related protein [Rhodococcus indonesiensis]
MNTSVDVSVSGNGALRVTLNRPDRMNAVTTETLDSIATAFENYGADPAVRVAVLSGAGRAFCTGADLSGDDLEHGSAGSTLDAANRAVAAIQAFPRPVVGAVNGPAAGVGVSLAIACDLTVATASSYFLLAFTRVGLMPDGGATALVAASIGRARALQLALLARPLAATAAAEIGLIADAFPDEEFRSSVDALVNELAEGPRTAYAYTKRAINEATLGGLDQAFAREYAGQSALLAGPEFAEGAAAFLAKRRADFTAV